jgi:[ribosomal protein S5]-alanine N-acetyltransferase
MLSLPETLLTERLVLQRLRYEDAEEIFYTYASKPEATRFVSWPTHKNIDDTRKFLSFAINAWNTGKEYTYSVRLKNQNRLIGSIGIVNLDYRIQFGYIFSPTQWNNGYATETCRKILQVLGTENRITGITTFVDVQNIYSIRVLEKCGLIAEGVFPNWFEFPNQQNKAKDCVLFACRRDTKAVV